MPNRDWDTTIWVSNSRKIMEQLGWYPNHTFEQGFEKTIDWFLKARQIQKFYRSYEQ